MQSVRASLALWTSGLMAVCMTPSGGHAIPPKAGALARPIRLMSAAKDDQLRSQLPQVNDPKLQQILDDASLILYTDAEIPSAYQDWSSGLQGIHSPTYNVSANRSEPYGNANIEFPWGAPAGTHRSTNVSTFRFLWLPRDEHGQPRPIVWYRRFLRGSSSQGYAWIFPVGSVVGEVLQLRSPTGQLYTFELRIRTRETGEWSVDVFRPFPTSGELVERIKALRPEWQQNAQLAKLVEHLEQPIRLERRTLADSNHSRQVFYQTMGVDRLPSAGDDQLVVQLLTETAFESALGATWRMGTNRVQTIAPTTDAPFHIVPARYDAGFIEVDRKSCMRCHETANHHVNEFQFGRDWYGRVRGSDGIFSIHPFDPSCISYSGFSQPARINGQWISAGLLASFDPKTHSRDVYHQLDQSDE